MQLNCRTLAAVAILILCSESRVLADTAQEDGQVVTTESNEADEKPKPPIKNRNNVLAMKNAVYVQMDRGPNPIAGDQATIIESIVVLRKEITKEHVFAARFHGAVISSASYDAAKSRGVLISGATTRIHNPGSGEVGAGWIYHPGDWSIGLHGTLDFEYFYRSRGLGLDISRKLFDENTTLSLFAKGYYDSVRMVRFDGSHDDDRLRRTIWTELGWTQILTPISLFNLTLTHVEQWGMLGIPFHSVDIGSMQSAEIVPDRRSRNAGTLRYKQAIDDDNAVELGYRYYGDSWGVRAHTLSTQFYLYLKDHTVLVEPGYRYYTQSQANFYARSFLAPQPFQTSDADLGNFSGHLFSMNVIFLDVYFLWLYSDYDIGLNYYRRTDGLDMFWVTMGFDLPI
jgi:hypothetical protein